MPKFLRNRFIIDAMILSAANAAHKPQEICRVFVGTLLGGKPKFSGKFFLGSSVKLCWSVKGR